MNVSAATYSPMLTLFYCLTNTLLWLLLLQWLANPHRAGAVEATRNEMIATLVTYATLRKAIMKTQEYLSRWP